MLVSPAGMHIGHMLRPIAPSGRQGDEVTTDRAHALGLAVEGRSLRLLYATEQQANDRIVSDPARRDP